MPIISLGPIEFRFLSGKNGLNWSDAELAFVTDRNEAGLSTRETALRAGFKSEHLLELAGEDNTADETVLNGTTYHGKRSPGLDGQDHILSSQQVAARAEYIKAMRESRNQARRAAQFAAGSDPSAS